MATFNVLAQVQIHEAAEFWGFLASKKTRKIGEITEKSVKTRKIGDFTENCPKFHQIDYRWRISCRPPPINEKSTIFRRYLAKFCSLDLMQKTVFDRTDESSIEPIVEHASSHNFFFFQVKTMSF